MRALHLTQPDAFPRYHDLPGTEPARVYLAGLGCTAAAAFAHVVVEPALTGRRSLLVDCLGFGHSDRPLDFSYALDAHAETVMALVDHLALDRYELIGHSFGGSIAALVAARRPQRVAALVLADGNLDPGGGAFSADIAAQSEEKYVEEGYAAGLCLLRGAAATNPTPTVTALVGSLQIADPHALYRSARSLVDMPCPTIREQLVDLGCRRVFLVGSRVLEAEGVSGPRDWPDLAGLPSAGIRVLVVRDAGHGMMWDNPAGFAHVTAEALITP